ncbi:neuronal acetylcholine receptor subunit alpha-9-I [Paramormyrops kingsleyae]|uniref:neuronal acetylcholine receptor subunit alpha-9-I n=1 Tax=Paramormyrops kingsleyae TaxID=1676925 RepID=UPI000CD60450|nr:neuronal acetylcholine receptor subunit alpha-9 [Paramormyrops kingsleyae]
MKTFCFILYFTSFLKGGRSAQGRYALKLLNDLMEDYSSALRPVEDTDKALNVTLQITLSQIKDMDERNQVLTAYLWIRQIWHDAYLKWNKDDYDGLEVIRIPSNLVWRPDIVLYNKADDDSSGPADTNVVLRYNGEITWDSPAITKSSCVVDVSYFPFDYQHCNLTFGSWTYNGNQVDVAMGMDSGDLSDYVENVEWECQGMPAVKNVIMYGCCSDPYPDITYTLHLKRRYSFYIYNLLLPCLMISFLAPLGFYLPADSGEKVSLGVTVLLALTVFQLMVAESMPPSDSVPLIGKYYIATMTMITASTALTIFIMNIHFCGAEAKPVPYWAKVLIIDYMSKIFFVYEVGESCGKPQSESSPFHLDEPLVNGELEIQRHRGNRRYHHQSNSEMKGRHSSRAPKTCHYNGREEYQQNGGVSAGASEKLHCPEKIISYTCTCTHHDRIMRNIEYITSCFREQRANCIKGAEWKKVAKVMDRFFMWIFFIMVFLMSILIISKAN